MNNEHDDSAGGRPAVLAAMRLEAPERVPYMCQLSIGHILLNTETSHLDHYFNTEAYVDSTIECGLNYGFDGILLHKPGRDPRAWEHVERVEEPPSDAPGEDTKVFFDDGGYMELPPNDDPRFYPPEGYASPDIDEVDLDHPLAAAPRSLEMFWNYKSLFPYSSREAFPEFYPDAIRHARQRVGNKISVHGEVKAPTDCLLNLLGMENGLIAFRIDPERVHRLLEYFTPRLALWAVMQVEAGCDAIKISSPYAGAGFLSREMYREFVVPYERAISEAVTGTDSYAYTHTCGAIGDRLDLMLESGIAGLECLDPPPLGDVELEDAKTTLADRVFIKGNLDSVNVLLYGSDEDVERETLRCLRVGSAGGGYILSTACSVAPGVKAERLKRVGEIVREFQAK